MWNNNPYMGTDVNLSVAATLCLFLASTEYVVEGHRKCLDEV